MLFLLPILMQVQVISDTRVPTIRTDSAEFPVWVDFTRCLTDGMKSTPNAMKENSPQYDEISENCRTIVQSDISAGHYKGISSKAKHRSHRKAVALLDITHQHMRTVYMSRPDVNKIYARVEKMGLGVKVYDPVAHLYDEYSNCVKRKYNEAPFRHSPDERVAGWTAAIQYCESLKAKLKLDADAIMRGLPDFQDAIKRKTAIDDTFDGHDAMVLKAASVEWSEPEVKATATKTP